MWSTICTHPHPSTPTQAGNDPTHTHTDATAAASKLQGHTGHMAPMQAHEFHTRTRMPFTAIPIYKMQAERLDPTRR
jgi:hypothetical protein